MRLQHIPINIDWFVFRFYNKSRIVNRRTFLHISKSFFYNLKDNFGIDISYYGNDHIFWYCYIFVKVYYSVSTDCFNGMSITQLIVRIRIIVIDRFINIPKENGIKLLILSFHGIKSLFFSYLQLTIGK